MSDLSEKKYYTLIHDIYSDLMLYEIESIKKGLIKDISFREIHTIEIIGHMGTSTMRELSDKANVKQSTMTVMIDKLIKKGLVKRFRSKDDRRIVNVELTELGHKTHKEHEKLHQKVTKGWLEILDNNEQEQLYTLLSKISKGMK